MNRILKYLLIFIAIPAWAQPQLSLQECLNLMAKNSYLQKNNALNEEFSSLEIKNLKTNYLPDLQLNAQGTYQSDVIKLDIKLPVGNLNLPEVDKDQYKVFLSIQQILWDGGMSKDAQNIEKIKAETQQLTTRAQIEKSQATIADFYFKLLQINTNKEILNKTIEELNKRITIIESAVKDGAMAEIQLQKLQVEKLKFQQKLQEVNPLQKSLKQAMIILLNDSNLTDFKAVAPNIKFSQMDVTNKVEISQLEKNKELIGSQNLLLKAQRIPKIAVFGQAGYGKPGLNMLSNTFDPYFIVGINANWKIWDFTTKNKKQKLKIQQELINNKKENLILNFNALNETLKGNIEKYNDLILSDKDIVDLQTKILKKASSQLDKGIISSNDYLQDLYAQTRYQLNLELHKTEKQQAIANYFIKNGHFSF